MRPKVCPRTIFYSVVIRSQFLGYCRQYFRLLIHECKYFFPRSLRPLPIFVTRCRSARTHTYVMIMQPWLHPWLELWRCLSGWHGCWLVAWVTEVIGLEMWFPALLTFPCQTALFLLTFWRQVLCFCFFKLHPSDSIVIFQTVSRVSIY